MRRGLLLAVIAFANTNGVLVLLAHLVLGEGDGGGRR